MVTVTDADGATVQIVIDERLANLLRKLTDDELAALEQNILDDGAIQEPLVVWKRDDCNVLIDGHHRYRIAEKYALPVRVVERQFADLEAAAVWVIEHQCGRRNDASTFAKMLSRGQMAESLREVFQSGVAAHRIVASQSGITTRTVERDVKLYRSVQSLTPQLQTALKDYRAAIAPNDAVTLAMVPPNVQNETATYIQQGGKPGEAVKQIRRAARSNHQATDVDANAAHAKYEFGKAKSRACRRMEQVLWDVDAMHRYSPRQLDRDKALALIRHALSLLEEW